KLRLVLLIAILLRFMDSFMIYAETYVVTRGGPGVSTTLLSHELVQTATVQFDLGEAGATSVIYFLIILCVSWAFFTLIVPRERGREAWLRAFPLRRLFSWCFSWCRSTGCSSCA